jgi:hypothetical protein
MPKPKKPRTVKVKKPADPERPARIRRALMHVTAVVMVIVIAGLGLWVDHRYVEQKLVFAKQPPKVVLKNRPVWMSDFLAEQIARTARPGGASSAFDHQLLVDTVAQLNANPWIRGVKQVRRVYDKSPGDTIEVDCDYRAPVALVHWKDYYWLVDADGVKLPEAFNHADVPRIIKGGNGKMNIRIVSGVRNPPPDSGMKWPGEDLAAGLELVKLLFGRDYTEEVVKVDVGNFARARDPKAAQIVLVTKYDTQVRWGQPITPAADEFFVEVTAAQKLSYMETIWKDKGRVDGNFAWVDIRYDTPTVPNLAAQTARTELHP